MSHILRMYVNQHPKVALTWAAEGKRRSVVCNRSGVELQRKRGQPWVLHCGAEQQWLLVTE